MVYWFNCTHIGTILTQWNIPEIDNKKIDLFILTLTITNRTETKYKKQIMFKSHVIIITYMHNNNNYSISQY